MVESTWFLIGTVVANFFIALFALWLGAFGSLVRKKLPAEHVWFIDKNITEILIGVAVLAGFGMQLYGILNDGLS